MVKSCAAFGCSKRYVKGSNISFHSFPTDETRRNLWTVALKRKNFKPNNSTKLCSKHFSPECFDVAAFGVGRKLKQDAVPSIFDFPPHLTLKAKKRKPPTQRQMQEASSSSGNEVFPKDEERTKIWLQKINREKFVPTVHSKVCSKHFTEECFDREKFGGVWLKKDAVPTVFDFPKHKQKETSRKRQANTCLSGNSQNQSKHQENLLCTTTPCTSPNTERPYSLWCIPLRPQLLPTSEQARPNEEKIGTTPLIKSRRGENRDSFFSFTVKRKERGQKRKKILQSHDDDTDVVEHQILLNPLDVVAREEKTVVRDVESGPGSAVNADRPQNRGHKRREMLQCDDHTYTVAHKILVNPQNEAVQEETVATREVESDPGRAANVDRPQNSHGVFEGDETVVKQEAESDSDDAVDAGRLQECDYTIVKEELLEDTPPPELEEFKEDVNSANEAAEEFDSNPSTPLTPATSRPSTSDTSTSSETWECTKRDLTTEILHSVSNKLHTMQKQDAFEVFGQYVANKLRALAPRQNIVAQKLINDVLFEGEMESLNRNFKVVEVETVPSEESQTLIQFFNKRK